MPMEVAQAGYMQQLKGKKATQTRSHWNLAAVFSTLEVDSLTPSSHQICKISSAFCQGRSHPVHCEDIICM